MKKIISMILPICLIFIFITNTNADDLILNSKHAVLIDGDTGRVLYGKECEEQSAMASTTKIMTCIIAVEYGDLNEVALVSKNAVNKPKVRMGVKENEQYKLIDLVYAMMLESYNDVSVVVAETVAGSVDKFTEFMNKKAKEIGALNTNFETVNGLDSENHYSTAKDMALIGAYAINNKKVLNIINTKHYTFQELKSNKYITVNNKNSYLSINDKAIGIKTGFTNKAGYCFVGATEYGDRTFVSCVLQCGWPPNSKYKWADTNLLMQYGKENFKKEIIYDNNDYITINLEEGSKNKVIGHIANDIEALISSEDEINILVTENISLPIKEGDEIGELCVWINDECIFEEKIYSNEDIEKNKFIYYFKKIWGWIIN